MLLDRKQTMNRRFISVLLAVSLPALAACGSDEPDTGTSALALSGVYRPVDQGAVGGIAFANGKDYRLVPASCTSESCVEIGTYRLDAPGHTLVLENGTTHATTTFALEVTKTSDTSASLVSSVRPLDLVDPGEQLTRTGQETTRTGQETTQNGQQLANGGSQLSGLASQLLQLIQQMVMNGQQMKRDDDAKAQAQADRQKKEDEDKAKQNAGDPAPEASPPQKNP